MTARLQPAELALPIVQAPLAGGPSTPALAAAVGGAGGLGFLAAGYRAPDAVQADVDALLAAGVPFGVNLFVPPTRPGDRAAVARYAASLAGEAAAQGAALGDPRSDDDAWDAKLEALERRPVPVVSFTFGCPPAEAIARLQRRGTAVWVTVTSPQEARVARGAGADALVLQGAEAGGHRASFDDAAPADLGLLSLLELVRAQDALPLVASGGIATGRGIAAVLAAGADAAQLGSAFLRTPEAGTSGPHRTALAAASAPTAVTRAFSGRRARGIVNAFMAAHPDAPSAYPEVHHLTAPLRAAARERGDAGAINLWAGETYALGREEPAGDLVRRLAAEAREALRRAAARA